MVVYTHPVVVLQLSTVHTFPSLQLVVVFWHKPVALLHDHWMHAFVAGHVELLVYMHVLFEHESNVHNELSLHTAANAAPVLVVDTHPVRLLHDPTKHLSLVIWQLLEMSA